jgi:hypothetical protein
MKASNCVWRMARFQMWMKPFTYGCDVCGEWWERSLETDIDTRLWKRSWEFLILFLNLSVSQFCWKNYFMWKCHTFIEVAIFTQIYSYSNIFLFYTNIEVFTQVFRSSIMNISVWFFCTMVVLLLLLFLLEISYFSENSEDLDLVSCWTWLSRNYFVRFVLKI